MADLAPSTAPSRSAADADRGEVADLRSHTARGMLINGGYQVGLVGLSALKGIVVAAFLTRSDYGVWGLLGLALWTTLGLKDVFGASERYVQQSEADQEEAFQRAFTVEVILGVATTPAIVVIVVAFDLLSGHPEVLAPGFALLLMVPATVLQFPVSVFYRRMDYKRQRFLQAINPVLTTVVTLVLAWLGTGYWSLVIGLIVGSWAAGIAAVRASPYRLALRYDRGALRRYVAFSMPLLVGGLATLGMFQVIFLVGAGPLGLAGLGAFTLVGNLVQFTDQADTIVTETLYPAICAVQERLDLLAELFVKSNRLSLIWAVPFGVGVALFGADLVRFVIGRQWLPAIGLLQIMGIVTAVHHVGYNWGAFFKAKGLTRPIALTALLGTSIVIGAGVPLMYTDHLVGLGYAFAISEAVGLLVRGLLMERFFAGFRIYRQLLRAFAPSVVAVLPVLAIRALAGPEDNLLAALAMLALYLLATALATLALERSLLSEALGYMFGRRTALRPA